MKRFLISIHIAFALVGIATTMIGPLLPQLVQRWHLSDREAGALFLVQFITGFCGAIASTRLAKRLSLHLIARGGLLLTAAGFLALATRSFPIGVLGIGIYGLGIGLCTPSISAAVSEAVPTRRAAVLNLLNFAWALGAITAPNLVLWALGHNRVDISGMLAGFAIVVAVSAFIFPAISATAVPEAASRSALPRATMRLIIVCGVLIFIYVGIENGVGGWLPTFAARIHGFTIQRRALLQDTFWAAFLLGRFSAPGILKYLSERLLLTISICISAAGTVAMLLATPSAALFASVAFVGVGCAPVFPTAIAILSHRLQGQSGSKLGFMYACAGLGGAVVPFCIGTLSAVTHNLQIGMALLLVAEILLLITHLVMSSIAAHPISDTVKQNRAIAVN